MKALAAGLLENSIKGNVLRVAVLSGGRIAFSRMRRT